jgi:hypothetical protein
MIPSDREVVRFFIGNFDFLGESLNSMGPGVIKESHLFPFFAASGWAQVDVPSSIILSFACPSAKKEDGASEFVSDEPTFKGVGVFGV